MSGKQGKNAGVWSVLVEMTVEAATPDEAVAFVKAELAMKLGDGGEGQLWQTEKMGALPRWQAQSVRSAPRVDEKGFPSE